MKLFLYLLFATLFCGAHSHAQGLNNIIVEKYYISDAKDSTSKGGPLAIGSVTYRIYVDMLPGYKFQAAYGLPNHELKIATTTYFFNNEDYGGVIPNVIPDRNLKNNTVMLDSWLSAGGASEGYCGVLKSEEKGNNPVVNKDSLLKNNNPKAGIPITIQDGLVAGTPAKVTVFGIDSLINIFGKTNLITNGTVFSTTNGSWATLTGATGPDSISNKVLIAQITTNGIFSFELNIQIGTPYGGFERYVAKNPSGEEFQLPSLTYPAGFSNKKPEIKMITPGKNKKFATNESIPVKVKVSDPDGSIACVQLFVNGIKYSTNKSAPYDFEIQHPENNSKIFAVVVDNLGATGKTETVTVRLKE